METKAPRREVYNYSLRPSSAEALRRVSRKTGISASRILDAFAGAGEKTIEAFVRKTDFSEEKPR